MAGASRTLVLVAILLMVPMTASAETPNSPATQASDAIPFKPNEGLSAATLTRLSVALLVAVVLAFVAVHLLKRFHFPRRFGATSGRIQVLEARRPAPRMTLVLVEVDSIAYLLVDGPNGVSMMRHRAPGDESENVG